MSRIFSLKISYRKKLYIDLAIFLGFLLTMWPDFTGLAFHEWFSIALGLAFVVHILLHWSWIVAVTKKIFMRTIHRSQLNYLLNTVMLTTFVSVLLSGFLESQVIVNLFGLRNIPNPIWEEIHSLSTDLVLFLVGFHLMLHWKWIVNALRQHLAPNRKNIN